MFIEKNRKSLQPVRGTHKPENKRITHYTKCCFKLNSAGECLVMFDGWTSQYCLELQNISQENPKKWGLCPHTWRYVIIKLYMVCNIVGTHCLCFSHFFLLFIQKPLSKNPSWDTDECKANKRQNDLYWGLEYGGETSKTTHVIQNKFYYKWGVEGGMTGTTVMLGK